MRKPRLRVTAAIIIDQQRIFCARKAPGKAMAGYWEFPGGKVELGETDAQSLARELHEELNLDCVIGAEFGVNVHEYDDKIIELAAYWVKINSGELVLSDHDDSCWLYPEQLNELNWAAADVPFVEKLQTAGLESPFRR